MLSSYYNPFFPENCLYFLTHNQPSLQWRLWSDCWMEKDKVSIVFANTAQQTVIANLKRMLVRIYASIRNTRAVGWLLWILGVRLFPYNAIINYSSCVCVQNRSTTGISSPSELLLLREGLSSRSTLHCWFCSIP